MNVEQLITSLENSNLADVLRIMENDYMILSVDKDIVKVKVLNSVVNVSYDLWTKACMIGVI
jgi:hypothetical protein